jgi:2-methylisocitrate lyase-like PEP mutase family enzyme
MIVASTPHREVSMTLVRERLRAALTQHGLVVAPFVYDGLQAMIAQKSGFSAVYMTGFGTAASRGMPDLGLLTMSEMVANARCICRAVEIPAICDADTGYGNPLNVIRTVEEFENAGAAALHIEDQVWPKRCGFLEGKKVIPRDEMVQKVRAACDGRNDSDLVIIARTDALQVEGWGGAEERARSYFEAGADLVFVDGIRTIADLDEYTRRLSDLPRLYNGQLCSTHEIENRGFKIMIHTGTLAIAYRALSDAMRELRDRGRISAAEDPSLFADLLNLLGVPEALARSSRYARERNAG